MKRYDRHNIGLMGHVIADTPDRQTTLDAIDIMVDAGVEIIEIQMPFSEPVADGPTFAQANQDAVHRGVDYDDAIKLMATCSAKHPQTNFLFMSYLNIPFMRGYDRFVKESVSAGAKGVIIPDLPIEHDDELCQIASAHNFHIVKVITPNLPDSRVKDICAKGQGLIYVAARAGVTGAESKFEQEFLKFIERVRLHTELPLAVGFGVREPSQIHFLRQAVDYAVVGTAAFQALLEGKVRFQQFWTSLSGQRV